MVPPHEMDEEDRKQGADQVAVPSALVEVLIMEKPVPEDTAIPRPPFLVNRNKAPCRQADHCSQLLRVVYTANIGSS
jgi:hypothetical protein